MNNFLSHFAQARVEHFVAAIAILIIGYQVTKWLAARLGKTLQKYLSKHQSMIAQRMFFYGGLLLFTFASLQQLGFNLSVILGAAGVFTVGIGFAAQTSLSNLISGIFLLIEHPFKIGDTITAKGFSGVVESVDLLSTRLCTGENTLIRIPNANVMQAEIINLSYFPTRRVEIILGVAHDTNIKTARDVLLKIASENPLAFTAPPPDVSVTDITPSSITISFKVWGSTEDYGLLKFGLLETIKTEFERENIILPFPQLTLHTDFSPVQSDKTNSVAE